LVSSNVSFDQSHVLLKSCSIKVQFAPKWDSTKFRSTKVQFYQIHVQPKSCSTKVRFAPKYGFYQIPFYQIHVLPKSVCSKMEFYQIPFYQSQTRRTESGNEKHLPPRFHEDRLAAAGQRVSVLPVSLLGLPDRPPTAAGQRS
jgi:hypothetical protein